MRGPWTIDDLADYHEARRVQEEYERRYAVERERVMKARQRDG